MWLSRLRPPGQRQVEHFHGPRKVDRTIRLNRIDNEWLGDSKSSELAKSFLSEFRIEAQRQVRRKREPRLLVRQTTQLDPLVQRSDRTVRIDRHDHDNALHEAHRRFESNGKWSDTSGNGSKRLP